MTGGTPISSPPPVRSRSTAIRFDARDGAALDGGQTVTIKALDNAEIVLVDSE